MNVISTTCILNFNFTETKVDHITNTVINTNLVHYSSCLLKVKTLRSWNKLKFEFPIGMGNVGNSPFSCLLVMVGCKWTDGRENWIQQESTFHMDKTIRGHRCSNL